MKASSVVLLVVCLLATCQSQAIVDTMVTKLTRYSSFASDQVSNARAIMAACAAYTTDVKQLAYVLSTAIGESSLRPIKEYRCAASQSCYQLQNRYWSSGFYGRGYVQLTWQSNYDKFGKLLGIDLVKNPDLALKPDVAGKIICIGMKRGLFTGVGLDNYLGPSKSDWVNARRIVNGLDKAQAFGDRGAAIASK